MNLQEKNELVLSISSYKYLHDINQKYRSVEQKTNLHQRYRFGKIISSQVVTKTIK